MNIGYPAYLNIFGSKMNGVDKDWMSMTEQQRIQAIFDLVPDARARGYIDVRDIKGFPTGGVPNKNIDARNINVFIQGIAVRIIIFTIDIALDMRININPFSGGNSNYPLREEPDGTYSRFYRFSPFAGRQTGNAMWFRFDARHTNIINAHFGV